MNYEIDICSRQSLLPVDVAELRQALICGLQQEQVASAVISVSIVDNSTIRALNRKHLNHDYPTDVISFALECTIVDEDGVEPSQPGCDPVLPAAGATIEGEIIASAEMACDMADAGRWTPVAELKLYLIHGMLHLCGYDDQSEGDQQLMRLREQKILKQLGLQVIYAEDAEPPDVLSPADAVSKGNQR